MVLKYSIIVPFYNSERSLARCVESVLGQSCGDFELILVDDGSCDSSHEIVARFSDDRVVLVRQLNGGVSSARNVGLAVARGEYVLFVDSDDTLEPNALEVLDASVPVADLTFFGSVFRSPDGCRLMQPDDRFYEGKKGVEDALVNLLFNERHPDYVGFTWNKLFKLSIIKEHGLQYVRNLSWREDEAFTFNYARFAGSVRTLNQVLYNYTCGTAGLTHARRKPIALYLYASAIHGLIQKFDNEQLRKYMAEAAGSYYFRALRMSGDRKLLDKAVAGFISVRRRYNPSIHVAGFFSRFFSKRASDRQVRLIYRAKRAIGINRRHK